MPRQGGSVRRCELLCLFVRKDRWSQFLLGSVGKPQVVLVGTEFSSIFGVTRCCTPRGLLPLAGTSGPETPEVQARNAVCRNCSAERKSRLAKNKTDRCMGTIVTVSARTIRPETISRLGRVELEQRDRFLFC